MWVSFLRRLNHCLLEKIKKVDIQEIFKDKNFIKSVKFVIETGKASTSALQRKFGFRYSVAANYLEYMAEEGIAFNAATFTISINPVDINLSTLLPMLNP